MIAAPIAITVGAGLSVPQGTLFTLESLTTDAMVLTLNGRPPGIETWLSLHTWKNGYRKAENWISSIGVAQDMDHHACLVHAVKQKTCADCIAPPPEDLVARLLEAAPTLPGSMFYLTPNGFRPIFLFDRPCTDRAQMILASQGAADQLERAIAAGDRLDAYKLDKPLVGDLGRLFFAPNAFAKGRQRNAVVVQLREELYSAADLALYAPIPEPKPEPAPKRNGTTNGNGRVAGSSVEDAVARWNSDNRTDWGRPGKGDCPVCNRRDCFGSLPQNPERWCCWSTNHSGAGVQNEKNWTGDALDIEASRRGRDRLDCLREDGYLAPAWKKREPRPLPEAPPDLETVPLEAYEGDAGANPAAEPDGPAPIPIGIKRRAYHNNSYLTAVDIITQASQFPKSSRGELGYKSLAFNEMSGIQELGGVAITDEDITAIRSEIERVYQGGQTKQGAAVGLKLSKSDISDAVNQVARENSYHPVRRYLESLIWDGVERIASVPDDILGALRSELNQALTKRFFVGAVRRVFEPGCKLDTMLILFGPQGCGKSTFFQELGGDWFIDSPVDIRNKDAYQVLRTAWIAEWGELEAISRARDIETVKQFLSSRKDNYRPSYGRHSIEVKRSGVIVGSTNNPEFLVDETGNRRFWIISVGVIELGVVARQRDQLWAEAVHMYRAGEQSYLTPGEDLALRSVHQDHLVSDVWDSDVAEWLANPKLPEDPAVPAGPQNPLARFTGAPRTGDILCGLGMPRKDRSHSDAIRVAKIMGRLGWTRKSARKDDKIVKCWFKK